MQALLLFALLLFAKFSSTSSWSQWNYTTTWSDNPLFAEVARSSWTAPLTKTSSGLWGPWIGDPSDTERGPRPRRGHSLVIFTSQKNTPYKGDTYVILFGGRDNDEPFVHIPRTYDVRVNPITNKPEFTTYTDKPVSPCNDPKGIYYTLAEKRAFGCSMTANETLASGASTSAITVGKVYNDVWAYKLCVRSPEPPSTPTKLANAKSMPGMPTYSPTFSPTLSPTSAKAKTSAPTKKNYGRFHDQACTDGGWFIMNQGALEGGCVIQLGILVCTTPSERYNHGAAMFNDGTMYVYGGFSQRCADYCDDLWFFDIFLKGWREVYPAGALSYLYTDIRQGNTFAYTQYQVPSDNAIDPTTGLPVSKPHRGPGKRWRHSMVTGLEYADRQDHNLTKQQVAIFGGHRLWHGFALDNNQSDNWMYYNMYPQGGYMDDLWIYTKYLDEATVAGSGFLQADGYWQKKYPKQQCYLHPGIAWADRKQQACETIWPVARAAHGSAFDSVRQRIWIHGGYTTYYPYLSTDGAGSGNGVSSLGTGGFVPFPGYEYYRSDLWYYDLVTGYWTEIKCPPDPSTLDPSTPPDVTFPQDCPAGRMDHVFLLLGDVLFVHGGFADNYYYDDTWYFNISGGYWLEKKNHTRAQYPDSCTDDVQYLKKHPECVKMAWPKHLDRDTVYPFDILPYSQQQYYWPDSTQGPYWNILTKDWNIKQAGKHEMVSTDVVTFPTGSGLNPNEPDGANYKYQSQYGDSPALPEFPYAATGPIQYAKQFTFQYNSSHNVTLAEWCLSVFGVPTAYGVNFATGQPNGWNQPDGKAGRASSHVLIYQQRKQRPGWDGCRNRQDKRKDLTDELTYDKPTPRASHRAVWYPQMHEIIMFGGVSYVVPQPLAKGLTSYSTVVKDDMWYFNIYHCLNDCSGAGQCYYGFCICYVGYYGEDCSNSSCPGTACWYDELTHQQTCLHACQAGYKHSENDVYVPDIAKKPCSRWNYGEVNGVCNGFGSTQCAPPMLGDDCGTRDCKDDCNYNGWCSIEYPVSRCMCQPGYFGETCAEIQCLNNCSFPNGVCNTTTGFCSCRWTTNPYNNSLLYKPWEGEDCSWLWAFSSSTRRVAFSPMIQFFLAIIACAFLSVMLPREDDSLRGQQQHTQATIEQ